MIKLRKIIICILAVSILLALPVYATENNSNELKDESRLLFEDVELGREIEANFYDKEVVFNKVFSDINAKIDFSHIVKLNFIIDIPKSSSISKLSECMIDEGRFLVPVLRDNGSLIGVAEFKKISAVSELSNEAIKVKSIVDKHKKYEGMWEVVKFYENSAINKIFSGSITKNIDSNNIKAIKYLELPLLNSKGLLYVYNEKEEYLPINDTSNKLLKASNVSCEDIVKELQNIKVEGDLDGSANSIRITNRAYVAISILILLVAIYLTVYFKKSPIK